MIMKKTTIMLPPDLKARALRKADKLGVSLGEFIRTSLQNALEQSSTQFKNDSLLCDKQAFYGKGPKDIAEKHDDYLYGEESS